MIYLYKLILKNKSINIQNVHLCNTEPYRETSTNKQYRINANTLTKFSWLFNSFLARTKRDTTALNELLTTRPSASLTPDFPKPAPKLLA